MKVGSTARDYLPYKLSYVVHHRLDLLIHAYFHFFPFSLRNCQFQYKMVRANYFDLKRDCFLIREISLFPYLVVLSLALYAFLLALRKSSLFKQGRGSKL